MTTKEASITDNVLGERIKELETLNAELVSALRNAQEAISAVVGQGTSPMVVDCILADAIAKAECAKVSQ